MSFQHSLKQIQTLLQKELGVFFEEKRKEAEKIDPELISIVDQIFDLTLRGGKRVRPFLCWLGYKVVESSSFIVHRKTIQKELLDAMMGIELFHTFALIHDDIIDQDEKRRGGDTIHEHFKSKVRNAKHFGQSMAILAGDLALSWADERMGKVKSQKSTQVY